MLPTYPRQGTTEASNRHRQKERKGKACSSQAKEPANMWPNRKPCGQDQSSSSQTPRGKKIMPRIPAVSATESEVDLRPQSSAQAKAGTMWVAPLFGVRGPGREPDLHPLPDESRQYSNLPTRIVGPTGEPNIHPCTPSRRMNKAVPPGAHKYSTFTPPPQSARLTGERRLNTHLAFRRWNGVA